MLWDSRIGQGTGEVQKVHTLPLPPGLRGASSGASDPGMDGLRTLHPMRFWVVRTYKISRHRSAGTGRTINLLMAGRRLRGGRGCRLSPGPEQPYPSHRAADRNG